MPGLLVLSTSRILLIELLVLASSGFQYLFRPKAMTNTPSNDPALDNSAEQLTLMEQLKQVELFNGRAAMVGIVTGIVVEGLTGFGIAHQIGLGALVDGYAACRTQFLPFCF
mgnify:CR=1 FL=1